MAMQDVYPVTTGEIVNNGSVVVSVGGWFYDTKTDDVKNTPTIDTLKYKYDNEFTS